MMGKYTDGWWSVGLGCHSNVLFSRPCRINVPRGWMACQLMFFRDNLFVRIPLGLINWEEGVVY